MQFTTLGAHMVDWDKFETDAEYVVPVKKFKYPRNPGGKVDNIYVLSHVENISVIVSSTLYLYDALRPLVSPQRAFMSNNIFAGM